MRRILYLLLFCLSLAGAYCAGQRVGHDHAWNDAHAVIGSHSAAMLSAKLPETMSHEEVTNFIRSSHFGDYKDSIIYHGMFSESLSSELPDFFGQKDFAIRVHERAFSRYPEIADQGPIKMKTVSDQHDEYFNKRVEWFYIGISSIRGEVHNNQLDGDAADSTR